jgi:hypothetical protein
MNLWIALFLAWGCVSASPVRKPAEVPLRQQAPVPGADQQKAAEKLIRDVFKDEFAKTSPADRLALVKKLIEQALDTKDDASARFVLLREARDLAASLGNADLAFRAIDMLGVDFKIEALKMKHSTLAAASKNARTAEELKDLAAYFLKLANEAALADDYETAVQAVASSASFARRSKDLPLTAAADARTREINEFKDRYERVKAAKAKLATQPADPGANSTVGQYLCLWKGEWEAGLKLLALGDDAILKVLAAKDLAQPADPIEQAAVGDGWWDRAEKEGGVARENLRFRAATWYGQTGGKLSGLAAAKVQKRLAEFNPGRPKGNWMDVNDPKRFGVEGKLGEDFQLLAQPGKAVAPTMKLFPDGEFDGMGARIRFGPNTNATAGLRFEDENRLVVIDGGTSMIGAFHREGETWVLDRSVPCPKAEIYFLAILAGRDGYAVSVNGDEKMVIRAAAQGFRSLGMQAGNGTATFDRLQLRRKE